MFQLKLLAVLLTLLAVDDINCAPPSPQIISAGDRKLPINAIDFTQNFIGNTPKITYSYHTIIWQTDPQNSRRSSRSNAYGYDRIDGNTKTGSAIN